MIVTLGDKENDIQGARVTQDTISAITFADSWKMDTSGWWVSIQVNFKIVCYWSTFYMMLLGVAFETKSCWDNLLETVLR